MFSGNNDNHEATPIESYEILEDTSSYLESRNDEVESVRAGHPSQDSLEMPSGSSALDSHTQIISKDERKDLLSLLHRKDARLVNEKTDRILMLINQPHSANELDKLIKAIFFFGLESFIEAIARQLKRYVTRFDDTLEQQERLKKVLSSGCDKAFVEVLPYLHILQKTDYRFSNKFFQMARNETLQKVPVAILKRTLENKKGVRPKIINEKKWLYINELIEKNSRVSVNKISDGEVNKILIILEDHIGYLTPALLRKIPAFVKDSPPHRLLDYIMMVLNTGDNEAISSTIMEIKEFIETAEITALDKLTPVVFSSKHSVIIDFFRLHMSDVGSLEDAALKTKSIKAILACENNQAYKIIKDYFPCLDNDPEYKLPLSFLRLAPENLLRSIPVSLIRKSIKDVKTSFIFHGKGFKFRKSFLEDLTKSSNDLQNNHDSSSNSVSAELTSDENVENITPEERKNLLKALRSKNRDEKRAIYHRISTLIDNTSSEDELDELITTLLSSMERHLIEKIIPKLERYVTRYDDELTKKTRIKKILSSYCDGAVRIVIPHLALILSEEKYKLNISFFAYVHKDTLKKFPVVLLKRSFTAIQDENGNPHKSIRVRKWNYIQQCIKQGDKKLKRDIKAILRSKDQEAINVNLVNIKYLISNSGENLNKLITLILNSSSDSAIQLVIKFLPQYVNINFTLDTNRIFNVLNSRNIEAISSIIEAIDILVNNASELLLNKFVSSLLSSKHSKLIKKYILLIENYVINAENEIIRESRINDVLASESAEAIYAIRAFHSTITMLDQEVGDTHETIATFVEVPAEIHAAEDGASRKRQHDESLLDIFFEEAISREQSARKRRCPDTEDYQWQQPLFQRDNESATPDWEIEHDIPLGSSMTADTIMLDDDDNPLQTPFIVDVALENDQEEPVTDSENNPVHEQLPQGLFGMQEEEMLTHRSETYDEVDSFFQPCSSSFFQEPFRRVKNNEQVKRHEYDDLSQLQDSLLPLDDEDEFMDIDGGVSPRSPRFF